MNLWQYLHQSRYLLRAQTWGDSAVKVFASGSVVVSLSPVAVLASDLRLPIAILRPLNGTTDPEIPDIKERMVAVTIIAGVAGDEFGQDALLGAHRASQTGSDGRGLFEIEEESDDAIGNLNALEGVSIRSIGETIPQPDELDGFGDVVRMDHVYKVKGTRQRHYFPASQFKAADAGSGDASLTWTVPPDRFDRRKVILRRASGTTAPTSITDGTGVTLAGNLSESVTDSPGAGVFSYALFGTYDEYGSSTDERVSDSRTQTVTVTS